MKRTSIIRAVVLLLIFSLQGKAYLRAQEVDYSDSYQYFYDNKGSLSKIIHQELLDDFKKQANEKSKTDTTYFLYENNRIKEKRNSKKNTVKQYKYNKNNKLVAVLEKQPKHPTIDTIKTYTYDSKQNMVSKKVNFKHESGLTIYRYCTYRYDEWGRKINTNCYNIDGSLKDSTVHYCTTSYNPTKEYLFDAKKVLVDSTLFVYDAKDSLLEKKTFAKGVLTKQEKWISKTSQEIEHWEFYYGSDGDVSSIFKTMKTYNTNGKLIQEKCGDLQYIQIEFIEEPTDELKSIKDYLKTVNININTPFKQLSQQLTKPYSSELDKCLAIINFICYYDNYRKEARDKIYQENYLDMIVGDFKKDLREAEYNMPDDFSRLFFMLAEYAGIKTEIVYAEAADGFKSHNWNVVKIDNEVLVVDIYTSRKLLEKTPLHAADMLLFDPKAHKNYCKSEPLDPLWQQGSTRDQLTFLEENAIKRLALSFKRVVDKLPDGYLHSLQLNYLERWSIMGEFVDSQNIELLAAYVEAYPYLSKPSKELKMTYLDDVYKKYKKELKTLLKERSNE